MTPEFIRSIQISDAIPEGARTDQGIFYLLGVGVILLKELAAQIADANGHLAKIANPVLEVDADGQNPRKVK